MTKGAGHQLCALFLLSEWKRATGKEKPRGRVAAGLYINRCVRYYMHGITLTEPTHMFS